MTFSDIEDIVKKENLHNINYDDTKKFVLELLKKKFNNLQEFESSIKQTSKICKILPSKPSILYVYRDLLKEKLISPKDNLEVYLKKKSVRSESGVLVITILTSPFPEYIDANGNLKKQSFTCGENCSYCPNEPEIIITSYIENIKTSPNNLNYLVTVITDDDMSFVRVFNYISLPEFNIKIDRINIKNIQENIQIDNKNKNKFDIEIYKSKIDISNLIINNKIIGTKIAQPRSYISSESGVARGNHNQFDPVKQMVDRIRALLACGHPADKLEILVLGGTWPHHPKAYRENFVRDLHFAANSINELLKGITREKLSLEEEMNLNMNADCRIIGLTLETRPDCISVREIKHMRKLNCTRIQLGIQHIDDDVLSKNNRNCYLKDTINALEVCMSNGIKVDTHYMPDMPGSTLKKDEIMFQKLLGVKDIKYISNNYIKYELMHPELQSDQWKIYPTQVTPFTEIKKWYDEGSYIPYGEDEEIMTELILNIKINVFPWIRLNRVVRDFEFKTTVKGGNPNPSLRDNLHKELAKRGQCCNCIRCREIGHLGKQLELKLNHNVNSFKEKIIIKNEFISKEKNKIYLNFEKFDKKIKESKKIKLEIDIFIRDYEANNGKEFYISYETIAENIVGYKVLFGFLRLRINNNDEKVYFDELKKSSLVRELHIYGNLVKHDDNTSKETQHIGFGKGLLKKAEEITAIHNLNKISVISGIGVRKYYNNQGYKLKNNYMIKDLNNYFILYSKFYYYKIYLIFINMFLFILIYRNFYLNNLIYLKVL